METPSAAWTDRPAKFSLMVASSSAKACSSAYSADAVTMMLPSLKTISALLPDQPALRKASPTAEMNASCQLAPNRYSIKPKVRVSSKLAPKLDTEPVKNSR